MPDELHHYEVSNEFWRVVADYIGEGNDGDYDEDDPEDYPHMRYDLYRVGEEEAVDSYCTLIDIRNSRAVKGMAHLFLNALGDSSQFPKREVQHLTWTIIQEAEDYLAKVEEEVGNASS